MNRCWLTGETNELSATRSYGYDAASNLTSQTDRNGRVTNFTYDGLNRLTAELWKNGGSTIRTLRYSYDAVGKLLSAGDADSAFAYTYDAANRLTQVDNNGTPSVPRVILTAGYDNLDRRTSLSATVAGTADFLNGYSYDALGRMTQVTQQGQSGGNTVAAKRVDLSYNAAGNFAGGSQRGQASLLMGPRQFWGVCNCRANADSNSLRRLDACSAGRRDARIASARRRKPRAVPASQGERRPG